MVKEQTYLLMAILIMVNIRMENPMALANMSGLMAVTMKGNLKEV